MQLSRKLKEHFKGKVIFGMSSITRIHSDEDHLHCTNPRTCISEVRGFCFWGEIFRERLVPSFDEVEKGKNECSRVSSWRARNRDLVDSGQPTSTGYLGRSQRSGQRLPSDPHEERRQRPSSGIVSVQREFPLDAYLTSW